MKDKLKDFYQEHYKKGLIIFIIINVILIALMILIYVLTKSSLCFIPFIFLIVFANAIILFRYLQIYRNKENQKINKLCHSFRRFYLELNQGQDINKCLNNLKEDASLELNELLTNLLDNNETNITLKSYLDFAKQFDNVLVEKMMINLFRYQNNHTLENLNNFNRSYLALKSSIDEEKIKLYKTVFDLVKVTPIIGAIIVVIVVIVTVIILVKG